MCNINALFIKNKTTNITPFVMAISSNSFASNSDGEGIYINSNNSIYKSENKMNLFKYENDIEKSNLIISHQRLSTSGFELEYNHPFANDNFVLVHNGVINQFKGDIGSDTYGFWIEFNNEFNKITSHLSREDRIKKVVKKLFEKNLGSYSILIYDKKTKQSFYFKGDDYPNIYFYQSNDFLFITTNGHNHLFLPMLTSDEFDTLEIENRTLYKIDKNFICYKIADLPKEEIKEIIEEEINETQSKISDSYNQYRQLSLNGKTNTYCDMCGLTIQGEVYSTSESKLCGNCWSFQTEEEI